MGLTNTSVGTNILKKKKQNNYNNFVIALAGNPNVGKSTIFNALTGMNQHTGNWTGKTVENAVGYLKTYKNSYTIVDIPGTYSLSTRSLEEEIARDYICFEKPDVTIVVCDATCLERNLNLALQILEITDNVIICINMIDEAMKKGISINIKELSKNLGVPVIETNAHDKKTLQNLTNCLDEFVTNKQHINPIKVKYDQTIEFAIDILEDLLKNKDISINKRWLSLKLLLGEKTIIEKFKPLYEELQENITRIINLLKSKNLYDQQLNESIVKSIVKTSESICKSVVSYKTNDYNKFDRKIDSLVTNKSTGYPIMIILLIIIFWITLKGANYPSEVLSSFFLLFEKYLLSAFECLNVPNILTEMLINGVYRVLSWVISVMLPPMAIFFPLFTLLEDIGYLPRIAYNLDKPFKKCASCGKQAITMCMGLGCNAAGVVGCRIIESKRERLLAILTNNFMPCNGRFPILIAIITIFFTGVNSGIVSDLVSVVILTSTILLSIAITFLTTKFLSKTILKGTSSCFALELPSYRKPQIGKIIIRSIFDRTLFVLGRSVIVAAPAGAIIWLCANIYFGDTNLLNIVASFLDPLGRLMGLDGVILIGFIFGLPANEIVLPIIIMTYLSQGTITEAGNLMELKSILITNGWDITTAISMLIFTIMHWPCSTTLLTIKKETESYKWMVISAILPTIIGVILCIVISNTLKLFI